MMVQRQNKMVKDVTQVPRPQLDDHEIIDARAQAGSEVTSQNPQG